MTLGSVAGLTAWPVKSLGGGAALVEVGAGPAGLDGDRRHAFADARRPDRPLSARTEPGLLRWSAAASPAGPVVSGPDGTARAWADPRLVAAVSDDLGREVVALSHEGGCADLPRSVLVTTAASHRAVERAYGSRLEPARWRTNVHLDLEVAPLAEHGWEGRRLVVGDVVLRLLHPCQRCTIPTWAPGGLQRSPELLAHFATGPSAGPFGINARVEVPGRLRLGAAVALED